MKYLGDENYNPTSLNGTFEYITKETTHIHFFMPEHISHLIGEDDLCFDGEFSFYHFDEEIAASRMMQ